MTPITNVFIPRVRNATQLAELVMPFSEAIIVPGPPLAIGPNGVAPNDVEIVLVVNGVVQFTYRGSINTNSLQRQWHADGSGNEVSTKYRCPVSIADTSKWRGLVQAYVKLLEPIEAEGRIKESPYTIVPLFIARQMPDAEQYDNAGTPPATPVPDGSISISASAICNGYLLDLIVDAELNNTSGTVLLEINFGDEWKIAELFSGAATRTLHWQPNIPEHDAPSGLFQIRLRDVAKPTLVSNTISLDIPVCSYDRYEIIGIPEMVCNNGVLCTNISLRYYGVEDAYIQLECRDSTDSNATWISLTVLNSTALTGNGEIHIHNRPVMVPPPGNYILRARNTTTQRYAEYMVSIDTCN